MRAVLPALLFSLLACGPAGEEPREPAGRALLDAPAGTGGLPIAALEIPAGAPTVVFLSDSIGAGLHLAEHESFPVVLQRRLASAGRPFHLVNSSESGRTSAGGVTALRWVARQEPDVVVVALGGNDGLRGVPLAEVEQNLRAMIEGAREVGARVLLLGVRLPPNYGEYGDGFDALYPRLAEEYELAFLPFYMQGVGGLPEMNLEDGLHPTAEGHERLADNVEGALRDTLEAVAAVGS
jgi:acyl-CoA thioesterase-1